jgi:hypothetical protein
LAAAAVSQGNGSAFAASVTALLSGCDAMFADDVGDAPVFATPCAADVPALSPLHAASATVAASKTQINPTPLDIMTSSYRTTLRVSFHKISYAN